MWNVSAYQSEDLRGHNSSQSGPECTARHPYIPKTRDVKMIIVNTDLSEHRMNTSTVYSFKFAQSYFPPKKTWDWFAQSWIRPLSNFVI